MSRFLSFLYGLFLFIALTSPEISAGFFHDTALAQELTDRPTNLIVIAGDGQVTLSFDQPSLAAYFDSETSYEITSSPPTTSTLTTQNTVTITGLTNGTVYQFIVTPKNDTATLFPSDPSAPVTPKASTPAPIIPATATLTLTINTSSAELGQSLTLTANITPSTATGSITFKDGSTILGTGTLANGTASLSTSALTIGAHNIAAIYAGDTNTSSATSTAQSVTISKATSALTLAASASSLQLGQSLTLTASLTPTSATGSVTFQDGATVLGTGTLSNGTASLSTSALTIGAHSLTAVYTGDTNTSSATSSAQSVTITPTTSALTLAASASSLQLGQSLTLTANITPSTATGSITFQDGTTVLGTGTLANGTASLSTSALTIGAHSLTAIYAGDTNTSSATSSAQSVTITPTTSALTLAASASSLQLGQSLTLTASLTPSTATGSITFKDGTTVLGTGTLANGTASLSTSALTIGAHSLTAVYTGDTNTSSATSSAQTVTISQATSALTLAASASSLQLGQSLTLTANITPSAATGSITFQDGATVLGTGTLSNGSASLSTSALTIGAHSLTAVYAGDTNTSSATSSAQSVTITSPPVTKTATSLALTSSSPTLNVGAQLTLTAQISPIPVSGTISFKEGASVLGTATLANGQASLSLTTLTSGTHILTASFAGDSTYDSSTSAELRVTISPAPVQTAQQAQPMSSQISLNVEPSPFAANQTLILQARINPQQATGLVTFKDGETPLGTANLVEGTAQLVTPRLGRGPHSLRADYAGAGNILPASSAPVSMMIADPALSLTLSLSNPNPALGDQLILTARLSAQDATGTISLQQSGTHLGTSPVSMGSAQFTLRAEQAGSFVLTAAYSGDAIYAPATSAALSYSIARRLCTISLTPSTQALAQGQSVILTVRLSPATASGQITLLEGAQALAQTNLTNGSASFTLVNLSAGAHHLQASYAGDQSCAPATSAPVTLTMARPNPVQDPKIRSLIATQTQTAMQMTQASLQVVQNRLEALHRDNVPDFVNALTAMPQSDQPSPLAFNAFAPTPLALTDPNRPLRGANTNSALTALAQISPNQTNASGPSQHTAKSSPYGALIALGPRPKFWTAGTMQFGQISLPASAGLQAQSSSHFTLSGLSAGVDQAITPQLTLGLAVSLSMHRQDLATDGSHSRARSTGLNSYASWQIAERLYLDGTLGLGRLLFSSRRLDEANGAELSSARSAWLIYGSIGLSQDFVREQLTLAPYAQLTWLDARFAANEETGAPDLALRFAPAHLSQQHVSLGLRARYDLAQNWGLLSPSLRLDYRRQLGSGFAQSISYAADPSTTYLLLDAGTDKDLFTATTGLIFQRFDHIEAALDLTLSRSRTGAHSQGLRAQARVPF